MKLTYLYISFSTIVLLIFLITKDRTYLLLWIIIMSFLGIFIICGYIAISNKTLTLVLKKEIFEIIEKSINEMAEESKKTLQGDEKNNVD